jgi:hypothetical protein
MRRADVSDRVVLEAALDYWAKRFPSTWDALRHRFPDAPWKILNAALERSSDRGLLDYGVSIKYASPTKKGLLLLMENGGGNVKQAS